ncbi:hydrogenase maturation nickel metallochaperone HypA [Candidatus Formimonas warabiya]|uniref:Hydrogenase maturation factor HypA n=1 Tax=Formimonas warabiya TaxID=1761012 RepID=A0A3G1KQ71_FORW1|nr:hydrogenase maturation nickel metallochaperone HypA [Candidatus Formimonas warabiya]ATW24619.1 hydrogenase maturation nickel metallochaperone HypA [Candidatus Formimonas warabiya]
MHEMAIAQGILDIALDHAAQHQAQKVLTISLSIGQMTGVEPEALLFCFNVLAEETIAAAAKLDINILPLVGFCQGCGQEFAVEGYRFFCPSCGSAQVEIISGRELQVAYLEVD